MSQEREKFYLGVDEHDFIYTISVLFSALPSLDRHAQFTHVASLWRCLARTPMPEPDPKQQVLGGRIGHVLIFTSCGQCRVRLSNDRTCQPTLLTLTLGERRFCRVVVRRSSSVVSHELHDGPALCGYGDSVGSLPSRRLHDAAAYHTHAIGLQGDTERIW